MNCFEGAKPPIAMHKLFLWNLIEWKINEKRKKEKKIMCCN